MPAAPDIPPLRIAFRSREDTLAGVVEASETTLTRESRAIARQIALDAVADGLATAGQLQDRIEAMTPTERGELAARARVRAGLGTLTAGKGLHSTPMLGGEHRDEGGASWQTCHVCGVQPMRETGTPMPVRARRWHCQAHAHLAADGDMDDWTPRLTMSANGLVDLDEQERETEREQIEAERRMLEHEERRAARRRDAPAVLAESEASRLAWVGANLKGPR